MVKNIQYSQLTKGSEEKSEDDTLIEWILENEPNIIIEVARFWVYNAYSIAPPNEQESLQDNYYYKQLLFILHVLEENYNVIFYSNERF